MGAGAILPDHLPVSTFRNQLGSIGYTAAAAVKDLLVVVVVVVEVVCVSFETVFCFFHRTHSTNTPKLNEASMLEGKRLQQQQQQQQHLYQCNQLLSISTHTPTTETSTIKLPGERAAAVVIISY